MRWLSLYIATVGQVTGAEGGLEYKLLNNVQTFQIFLALEALETEFGIQPQAALGGGYFRFTGASSSLEALRSSSL
jgi:hypothetical protein